MTLWVTVAVLIAAVLLAAAWTVGVVEGRRRQTEEATETAKAERRRAYRLSRRDARGRARRDKIRASVTDGDRPPT